jgi:hypothetical protein
LQLADIPAGAFFQAVECNRPDDCDPQYAKLLKPIVARRYFGSRIGYGLKTMPGPGQMDLVEKQKEVFEYYGYPKRGWQAPGS